MTLAEAEGLLTDPSFLEGAQLCNPDMGVSAASALVRGSEYGWPFPLAHTPALISAFVDPCMNAALKTKLKDLLLACAPSDCANMSAIACLFCVGQDAGAVQDAIRKMARDAVPLATALLCALASRDLEATNRLLTDPRFVEASRLLDGITPPLGSEVEQALVLCIQPQCRPALRLSAASALVKGVEFGWSFPHAQAQVLILAIIDSNTSANLKTQLQKLLLTCMSDATSIARSFCEDRVVGEVQDAIRNISRDALPMATALLCALASRDVEAAKRLLTDPNFRDAARLLDDLTPPLGSEVGQALLLCIQPPCNPDVRLSAVSALVRGAESGWSCPPAHAPTLILAWLEPGSSWCLRSELQKLLLTSVSDGPDIALCCKRVLEAPQLERLVDAVATETDGMFKDTFAPVVMTAALLKNPNSEQAVGWLQSLRCNVQFARGDAFKRALALFMCLRNREVRSLLEIEGALHGSVLHAVASVGDLDAFKRLVNVGAMPLLTNAEGQMPLALVPAQRKAQFQAYIDSLAVDATRVGDGNAYHEAMGSAGTIVEVEWLCTQPIWYGPANLKTHHSLLKLTVQSGASEKIYALETCQHDSADEEQWKDGVIISEWRSVFCQQLDLYAKLRRSDLSGANLTVAQVRLAALREGAYDLKRNNCHQAAKRAYNYCACLRRKKLWHPNGFLTAIPTPMQKLFLRLLKGNPLGCHPTRMESRPAKSLELPTPPPMDSDRELLMLGALLSAWIYDPVDSQAVIAPPPGDLELIHLAMQGQHLWDDPRISSCSHIQWALLQSEEMFALVFKGTSSLKDVWVNMRAKPVPTDLDGSGLQGHFGMWQALRQRECDVVDTVGRMIRENSGPELKPLLVCGHSLGGGYALLAALSFMKERRRDVLNLPEIEVITFGAPQVIVPDEESPLWSCLNGKTVNLIHTRDVVPRLPKHLSWLQQADLEVFGITLHTGSSIGRLPQFPEFGDYGHVGKLIFIQKEPSKLVAQVEATDKDACLKRLLEPLPPEALQVEVEASNSKVDVKLTGFHLISGYVQTLRELPPMTFGDIPASQAEG